MTLNVRVGFAGSGAAAGRDRRELRARSGGPRRSFAAAAVTAAALALGARSGTAQSPDVQRPEPPSSVIRNVQIERGEVFDSLESRRFWGFRIVNVLHAATRPYVIRRELLFAPGERYDSARVHESERNLRALGIFRSVEIDTVATDSGVTVRVRTTDGWTTHLGFGLRTSGSQRVLNAFVQDVNLLGTSTVATLGYQSDPDRSTVLVGFDTPRMIANKIGVGGSYSRRSDGHAGVAAARYPFVSVSSRGGGVLSWQIFDGRVLHYAGGTGIPEDSARRKFALLRGDGAIALLASPSGYVRLGLTAQLQRDDFGEVGSSAAIPRTITVAAGPYVAVRAPRYIQLHNYEAMGRVEDVDLGPSLRADLTFAPSAWGYPRGGIGGRIGGAIGTRIPWGFAQFGGSAGGLRTSSGTDSSSFDGYTIGVVQPNDAHLFVADVVAGRMNNPPFGAEYDLGLGYGVRAFPSHAFTGDRYYLANAEYRWLALPHVLGLVGVGVATFVDHGGAWFDGAERRTGTDAGVGLRIGSIRSARSIVGRLDLAYRFRSDVESAGWVFSLGRGFAFQRF